MVAFADSVLFVAVNSLTVSVVSFLFTTSVSDSICVVTAYPSLYVPPSHALANPVCLTLQRL